MTSKSSRLDYLSVLSELLPKLSKPAQNALKYLMAAPEHELSVHRLTQLLEYKDVVSTNGTLGRLGKQIYDRLKAHSDPDVPEKFQWWTMIATWDRMEPVRWKLRPEVADALRSLGYEEDVLLPDETSEPEDDLLGGMTYLEGAPKVRSGTYYERKRTLRQECLNIHRYDCAICEMNFGDMYGEEVRNFIHVHHRFPLADSKAEHNVDPRHDLTPVCPNCHAVIHAGGQLRSIEEVKAMLAAKKANSASHPTR